MDNSLIIYDPVPYLGGSKIATQRILRTRICSPCSYTQIGSIHVLTLDTDSWNNKEYAVHKLHLPYFLQNKTKGTWYYLKQIILFMQVLLYMLTIARAGSLLAISGPGVDIAGLFAAKVRRIKSIQLIQGPVAVSRLARIAVNSCCHIFYLESMKPHLIKFLASGTHDDQQKILRKSQSFVNGLDINTWPKSHHCKKPRVFWAASLLKWKGLDILQRALLHPAIPDDVAADVCYITPKQASSAVLSAPKNTYNMSAWHNPVDIDELRNNCSIFVSTSANEPFGLSILEAMAAGLCPVIPEDGAYWDKTLTDGLNCIKYPPGDHIQLAEKLAELSHDMITTLAIGQAAQEVAGHYTAQEQYNGIITSLIEATSPQSTLRKLNNAL